MRGLFERLPPLTHVALQHLDFPIYRRFPAVVRAELGVSLAVCDPALGLHVLHALDRLVVPKFIVPFVKRHASGALGKLSEAGWGVAIDSESMIMLTTPE